MGQTMKIKIIFVVVIMGLSGLPSFVHAELDYSSTIQNYTKERNSKADAQTISVYGAWSEDMINQIESGRRDGIVVKGDDADQWGIGNVIIDKNAVVNGPIIVKPEIENSTVIFQSPKTSRF